MKVVRFGLALLLTLAGQPAAAEAVPAVAVESGEAGLPPSRHNVELVATLHPSGGRPGRFGDVAVSGGWAYLAALPTAPCVGSGVHVIDVTDLSRPMERGFLPAIPGSAISEVQVLPIDTPRFRGDILVHNNEVCANGGRGGISIWDVTDPRRPELLAGNAGDATGPNGKTATPHPVHSAVAWAAGSRAYVVAVDEEDDTPVDIFDITDPRRPRLVAETGLRDWPQVNQSPSPQGDNAIFHDVVVADVAGRRRALLSYWDAGHVQLDIDDPAHPVLVGDTDFDFPDPAAPERGLSPEGNAHYAEFTADGEWIVGTDEDESPYRVVLTAAQGETFPALQADGARQIRPGEELQPAGMVFVGSACVANETGDASPAGRRWAVVEDGECGLDEKVAAAAAAGYRAVVVFNGPQAQPCNALVQTRVNAEIPVFLVGRLTGLAILGRPADECPSADGVGPSLPPVGTAGRQLGARLQFDGWGAVHLYRNRLVEGRYPRVATFALPEAQDESIADEFGVLSAHEVAADPRRPLVYVAHNGGGLRVLRIRPGRFEEVGHYTDGNSLWGVEAQRRGTDTIVFASDRNHGLVIVRYAGPG